MPLLSSLVARLTRYRPSKMVRPWALSAPILVLLVALPLLRPLRYPLPRQISDEEQARLATIQAIVEHRTLHIDATDFTTTRSKVEVKDHWYSNQPPTMAVLLSASYWVMHRNGMTFRNQGPQVMYLLTLLGATIPAACAAGLIYRMGRLFELRRWWRAALAAAAVLCTGMISYATVLNPHVPAATLVLAAAACLVHVTLSPKKTARPFWMATAGACAALAAAIDPTAIPFLFLLLLVVGAVRRRIGAQAGGILAYAIGAALPIAVHAALTVPITGDFFQGITFMPQPPVAAVSPAGSFSPDGASRDEDDGAAPPLWKRLAGALFGAHGVLSHFPVLLLGVAGVGMVMHRHWPTAAKVLASATCAGALLLIVVYSADRPEWKDWRDAMFAARWFVVFTPLVLFWAGAWLRRKHRPGVWASAAVLMAFSLFVSVVGAVAGPLPQEGFDHYTAAEAWDRLVEPTHTASSPPVVAGSIP
jgi:hypothetical protein